jgi:hypothetical protein
VARLDLVMAQPFGEVQHVLEGQVEGVDGLAHVALARLDLLRDGDLFLPREQGDAAHLLEVHADGIGRLGGSPFGLLRLRLLLGPLRLLGLAVGLLGECRLLDGLDLDVHLAEDVDDLVELLGSGPLAGHHLAVVTALVRDRRGGSGASGARVTNFSYGLFHVSFLWPLHAGVPSRAQPGQWARITGLAHRARPHHVTGLWSLLEQSRNRVALARGWTSREKRASAGRVLTGHQRVKSKPLPKPGKTLAGAAP